MCTSQIVYYAEMIIYYNWTININIVKKNSTKIINHYWKLYIYIFKNDTIIKKMKYPIMYKLLNVNYK